MSQDEDMEDEVWGGNSGPDNPKTNPCFFSTLINLLKGMCGERLVAPWDFFFGSQSW